MYKQHSPRTTAPSACPLGAPHPWHSHTHVQTALTPHNSTARLPPRRTTSMALTHTHTYTHTGTNSTHPRSTAPPARPLGAPHPWRARRGSGAACGGYTPNAHPLLLLCCRPAALERRSTPVFSQRQKRWFQPFERRLTLVSSQKQKQLFKQFDSDI